MTPRSRHGRLFLAVASCAVTLAVAEIVVRKFSPERPPLRLTQFADVVERGHRFRAEDIFVGDPELFWRLGPGIRLPADARPVFGLVSNEQGLREDRLVPRRKEDGEIRVLFLGDSATFGYLLGHEDTFVQVLEQQLRAAFPGQRIECINAGVPGYSLFQGTRFLEIRGLGFEPDLVVASFGWNDSVGWDGLGDLEHHERFEAARPIAPLRWSRLAALAWNAWPSAGGDPARIEGRPRLLPYEFAGLLERLQAGCRRADAELLLLVWPSRPNVEFGRFRDYRTPLQEIQYAYGTRVGFAADGKPAFVDGVSVLQDLSRQHAAEELFFDRVHTTARANRHIAGALGERVVPWIRWRARS